MPDTNKFSCVRGPKGCFSNYSKPEVFIGLKRPTTEHWHGSVTTAIGGGFVHRPTPHNQCESSHE